MLTRLIKLLFELCCVELLQNFYKLRQQRSTVVDGMLQMI